MHVLHSYSSRFTATRLNLRKNTENPLKNKALNKTHPGSLWWHTLPLKHSPIVKSSPRMNKGQIFGTSSSNALPVENPAKAERSGTQAKKMCKRRIKSMGMTTKTLTKLSEVQAVDDRGQTSWTMRTKKKTTTSRSIRRSPRQNTHSLLLKRTQNPTTSRERSPAAKKARPQCAKREQPQAPTSGPALA